jgi:hypothetical protein
MTGDIGELRAALEPPGTRPAPGRTPPGRRRQPARGRPPRHDAADRDADPDGG